MMSSTFAQEAPQHTSARISPFLEALDLRCFRHAPTWIEAWIGLLKRRLPSDSKKIQHILSSKLDMLNTGLETARLTASFSFLLKEASGSVRDLT